MSFKIKHTNSGHLKELKRNIKAGQVKIGLPKGTEANEAKLQKVTIDGKEVTVKNDSLTLVEVGFFHEFGTQTLPERSFIRVPVQANMEKYKELSRKQAQKIYQGKQTVDNALGILGLFMQTKMQATFGNNDWEANTANTVKQKGSSSPLIDTGQLRQSITWQLVKKD